MTTPYFRPVVVLAFSCGPLLTVIEADCLTRPQDFLTPDLRISGLVPLSLHRRNVSVSWTGDGPWFCCSVQMAMRLRDGQLRVPDLVDWFPVMHSAVCREHILKFNYLYIFHGNLILQ